MSPELKKLAIRVGYAIGVGLAASLSWVGGVTSSTAEIPELVREIRLLNLRVREMEQTVDRLELKHDGFRNLIIDRLDAMQKRRAD